MSSWHRNNPEEYERYGGSPAERALGLAGDGLPTGESVEEVAECLEGPEGCKGEVAFREVPGREAFGLAPRSFPRCEAHYERACEVAQQTAERYGSIAPPSDFSPLDAGESWDEGDY